MIEIRSRVLISTEVSSFSKRELPTNTLGLKKALNYEKMKYFIEMLDFKISYLFLQPLLKNKSVK